MYETSYPETGQNLVELSAALAIPAAAVSYYVNPGGDGIQRVRKWLQSQRYFGIIGV